MPALWISGSLAYDELYSYAGKIRSHIPENPDTPLYCNIRAGGPNIFRGGCGGNTAFTISLFKVRAVLSSWAGKDGFEYCDFLKDRGIDTSHVIIDEENPTPRGVLLADSDQDQFLIFSAQKSPAQWAPAPVSGCTYGIITAGLPEKTEEAADLLRREKIPFAVDPGKLLLDISGEEIISCISDADTVIMNQYEFELFSGLTGINEKDIGIRIGSICITMGNKGCAVYEPDGVSRIPAVKPDKETDPNGAGDAFLAAFSTARFLGYSRIWAARFGTTAASFSLEGKGAQSHFFSIEDFQNRLRTNYGSLEISMRTAYQKTGLPFQD